MASKRTEELIQADKDHLLHPYSTVGQTTGIIIEEAHGVYLVDTDGKEYMDMSAQLVCCNLGHRRPELMEAIRQAIDKIDYQHVFFGHSHPYVIELADKLSRFTPGDLNHFLFTSGGSEATDSAIKIARLYWGNIGMAHKYKIISMYNSYHGVAGMSTYATGLGRGALQNPFGPVSPGFIRVPSHYAYRSMFGDVPDPGRMSTHFLEQIILAEGPDSIAAFIAEPVMGAGGSLDPPPDWWPTVREICTKYDILLIVDEVMTGFCRTGKMFAQEHWNIQGDLMTMAKGLTSAVLPLGGVAVSDKVYEGLKDKWFRHGFTYGAHPISCAVASAALDVYVKDSVAENAARVGAHMKRRLKDEFLPLPCIGDVSGLGLHLGIELVNDKQSKMPLDTEVQNELKRKMFDAGIFIRIGEGWLGNRIFVTPPCVITKEEVDKALEIMKPLMAALKPLH